MTGHGFEIGRDGPSAVVVGVDGSDPSLRAAAYAVGVCRRQGGRLVVVYVREPGGGVASMLDTTGASSAAAVRHQDDVERALRDPRSLADARGVPVEVVVRTGDPYQVLSDVAHEVRADGVVVGSSEGIGHRIAGSLAVRLVRNARWPVTVVP
ncbi:universal stress protein [Cellulomonas pakistanensis]|uniref:Universal stress protein A n=1 Tax=Cellulomonas pakistanensis TaxID=992287 RepID=A0A919PBQ3_9CELL|nr:universal stress protein [Cellulomonas pakistanensis]GIG37596.1 universal stress protein A [Cellulomonas pakistanensis]